jgi:hypothetical protein
MLFHRKRRVRVHMVPVAGVDDLDVEGGLTGVVDGHAGRVWWLERLQGVSV